MHILSGQSLHRALSQQHAPGLLFAMRLWTPWTKQETQSTIRPPSNTTMISELASIPQPCRVLPSSRTTLAYKAPLCLHGTPPDSCMVQHHFACMVVHPILHVTAPHRFCSAPLCLHGAPPHPASHPVPTQWTHPPVTTREDGETTRGSLSIKT